MRSSASAMSPEVLYFVPFDMLASQQYIQDDDLKGVTCCSAPPPAMLARAPCVLPGPCRWTRCSCPGPAQRSRRPRSPPATAPPRRCGSRRARPRAPTGTLQPTLTRPCPSRGPRRPQAAGAPPDALVRHMSSLGRAMCLRHDLRTAHQGKAGAAWPVPGPHCAGSAWPATDCLRMAC